jgi:hypothetical protein
LTCGVEDTLGLFVHFAGDLLIIGAQVIAASQMVLEEKFVSGLDIPALQAVGWEGMYLTTMSTYSHN